MSITNGVCVRVLGYLRNNYETGTSLSSFAVIGPSALDYCLIGREGSGKWRLRWYRDGWQIAISDGLYDTAEQALADARKEGPQGNRLPAD